MINKYESNNNINPIDMPGNISIISKDNMGHGPSLVQ